MKIFLGWWVLLGIFLIYMANNGILMYTLPLFYPELIAEFGWNAEEVTRPAALFFVVAALLTPFMGALFDRYPTQRVMMFGILALVAGLACYPFVASLAQLTAIYMVFAVGLAGCGLVPHMLILTRWFKRYRGLAAGLLLLGSSFGGAIFPLLAKETLLTQGWRPALALVALLGSAMMLIAALWLVRNSPQELGLAPDGAAPEEPESAQRNGARPDAPAGVTLRQAAATPVFYLLAFLTATLWFCIVGMLQHQSIFLSQDLGVDKAKLPLIFSLFFWAAIVGKFAFGWLSDLFNKVVIMLLAVLCFAAGLALLPVITADNKTLLQLYAVLFGVGFGGTFSMIQLVLAECFAGAHFGKILAMFTMIDSLAGAAGIKYLGWVRVEQGSYLPAFEQLLALCAASAVLTLALLWMRRAEAAPGRAKQGLA